jgi:hypothetical protein
VAQSIITGLPLNAQPPPVDAVDLEFSGRFETVNLVTDNQRYAVKTDANRDTAVRPAAASEVVDTIKRIDQNSAAGPDREITARLVKQLPVGLFLRLWNTWLYLGHVPTAIKQSRTTLLPKTADRLDDPSNWRPITVASVWQRTFSAFLVRRLSVNLNPRQKAFTQGIDGVGEHTAVIRSALREASRNSKAIDVVLLDVAKAFDNVSHASLRRALRRLDVYPM